MPTPFAIYSEEMLPRGFVYPDSFRAFGKTGVYPAIQPWWFVDAGSRAGALMYSVRRHDGRNLVPFAKVDDGRGDVACFDGDDSTGNPRVLMLVLDDSGRSYSFVDFAAWLASAEADAQSWSGS